MGQDLLGDGSPGGSPSQFFHSSPIKGEERCTLGAGDIPIYGAAERGNGWLS